MTHKSNCRKVSLVQSKSLSISHCHCGMVNLNMGPVSLRLSEMAFAGLADAVVKAQMQIANSQNKTGAPFEEIITEGDFVAG